MTTHRLPPATEPPYDPELDGPPPADLDAWRTPHTTNQPAQAPEAERALLGALILDPELATPIALEVDAHDFYQPRHETIFDTAQAIAADPDRQLDHLTLLSELGRRGHLKPGHLDAPYLHTLMQACPLPANYPSYAADVRDAARIRNIADVGRKLLQLGTTHDLTRVNTALDDALQTLDDTVNRFGPRTAADNPAGLHDLAWILTGTPPEVPPPTLCHRSDGHALFYAGKVNGIFGDPEGGKTWLAQAAIVEALNDGGTAAMIDVDHNGPDHTAARLLLLGARLDDIANPDRFRYYEPEDGDQLLAAVNDIVTRRPTVTLIDSLGEVFPLLGVNTNDGDEITTAMRTVCTRPATAGSCVITIDHLPKSAEARTTGYAIGSIAKKRMIRGAYLRADVRVQPAPGARGVITLRIEKDTAGELRKSSGGGYAGTLTLDSTQPHITRWEITREEMPKNDDGTFRPTALMERISRYIEANDQCTFTDIKDAVSGKDKWLRDAITLLVHEGFVARIDGARRAKLHHSIAQYRENEDDHVA